MDRSKLVHRSCVTSRCRLSRISSFRPRPQPFVANGPRTLTHSMGDVLTSDDQVIAVGIFATQQYVCMGPISVPMVGSYPVELCTQILLHLRHQAACEALKVCNGMAVLRGDDEAEMMSVVLNRFSKASRSTLSSVAL